MAKYSTFCYSLNSLTHNITCRTSSLHPETIWTCAEMQNILKYATLYHPLGHLLILLTTDAILYRARWYRGRCTIPQPPEWGILCCISFVNSPTDDIPIRTSSLSKMIAKKQQSSMVIRAKYSIFDLLLDCSLTTYLAGGLITTWQHRHCKRPSADPISAWHYAGTQSIVFNLIYCMLFHSCSIYIRCSWLVPRSTYNCIWRALDTTHARIISTMSLRS